MRWLDDIMDSMDMNLIKQQTPGDSEGQGSLVCYSLWGHKESDTTCQLNSNSSIDKRDARYWMLGAGALGRPRGMEGGGRREEGSGWGTHVYLWQIHFDILQN